MKLTTYLACMGLYIAVAGLTACSGGSSNGELTGDKKQTFLSKGEAEQASPIGIACVSKSPVGNSGKSQNSWEPAYLRGDVNSDGEVNRQDGWVIKNNRVKVSNLACGQVANIAANHMRNEYNNLDYKMFVQLNSTSRIGFNVDILCQSDCELESIDSRL